MNQLIEVKNGGAICDSRMVAEKFGVQHTNVTRTTERIIEKLAKSNPFKLNGLNVTFPIFLKHKYEYRGRVIPFTK